MHGHFFLKVQLGHVSVMKAFYPKLCLGYESFVLSFLIEKKDVVDPLTSCSHSCA